MYCPNCGLQNEAGAKFCANCGTTLAVADAPPAAYTPLPLPNNSPWKNIGIGCLVAVLIVLFVGVSCTRSCFGHRRSYILRHRY